MSGSFGFSVKPVMEIERNVRRPILCIVETL